MLQATAQQTFGFLLVCNFEHHCLGTGISLSGPQWSDHETRSSLISSPLHVVKYNQCVLQDKLVWWQCPVHYPNNLPVNLIIVTCQLVGSLTSNSTVQINHHGISSTLPSGEIMSTYHQWKQILAYAFD